MTQENQKYLKQLTKEMMALCKENAVVFAADSSRPTHLTDIPFGGFRPGELVIFMGIPRQPHNHERLTTMLLHKSRFQENNTFQVNLEFDMKDFP